LNNKIPFIFGIHCHQPYANFYHVVDHAVSVSYAPFIEVALQNKEFKFVVHYSGWLLDYIRNHHMNLFKNLQKAASNGQIEFFTGGFYEPILTAIPSDDRRGQIELLSKYINNYFGQQPNGLWLTERVWDPSIISDLYETGIENIIIDDYHLIAAGFKENTIKGYFRTEQDGYPINLFPINKTLRYFTPFKGEDEVVAYINTLKNDNHKFVSCFDDGEKFGLWPSTYEWVYQKGWLKRFIDAIVDSNNIEFIHYKDATKRFKAESIAYLPITSYIEMGEWALSPDIADEFDRLKMSLKNSDFRDNLDYLVKGTVWKNFLVKYSEADKLHKKTLDLSIRGKKFKTDDQFLTYLYQSQCNDSLWHGVFGGLYLPNLRNNAWTSLINAQKRFEELAGIKANTIEMRDINFDSYIEPYYIGKEFNALFSSKSNGQMITLEVKDTSFNLMNIIARRKEHYHSKFIPIDEQSMDASGNSESANNSTSIHDENHYVDSKLLTYLKYDWYDKNSFIDHFTYDFSLSNFQDLTFVEIGDFVNQPSNVSLKDSSITFNRSGGFYTHYGKTPVEMSKKYTIKDDVINFEFKVVAESDFKCDYVNEINLHFADINRVTINGLPISEPNTITGKKFVITDPFIGKDIIIEYDSEVVLCFYTIHTLSQSESGIDLTVQGVSILSKIDFDKEILFKGKLTII